MGEDKLFYFAFFFFLAWFLLMFFMELRVAGGVALAVVGVPCVIKGLLSELHRRFPRWRI